MIAYITASGDTFIHLVIARQPTPFAPFLARLRRSARPAGPVTTKKKPAKQDMLSRFRHSLHPAHGRPLDLRRVSSHLRPDSIGHGTRGVKSRLWSRAPLSPSLRPPGDVRPIRG